ncbi:hypothetical protein GCM10010358_38960 [Streptomyces minutiscleroticus]|uniref:Uncharacterized protein n=2 Tax=Streptomyces minutiscleroticus TaxID=68238 RepID=A0A918U267_9ACTN|nr:hypothetical protein GCM10010358_38960 [Streptomyces minutiscleroticus]
MGAVGVALAVQDVQYVPLQRVRDGDDAFTDGKADEQQQPLVLIRRGISRDSRAMP